MRSFGFVILAVAFIAAVTVAIPVEPQPETHEAAVVDGKAGCFGCKPPPPCDIPCRGFACHLFAKSNPNCNPYPCRNYACMMQALKELVGFTDGKEAKPSDN